MFKGLHGLNPGNQAFKQFKCPILNVLRNVIPCNLVDINPVFWKKVQPPSLG